MDKVDAVIDELTRFSITNSLEDVDENPILDSEGNSIFGISGITPNDWGFVI